MNRYQQAKAERKCVRCYAGLLDEEIWARCSDCLDVLAKQRSRQRLRARTLRKIRAKYHQNPEYRATKIALHLDRRLRKKIKGECYECDKPCLEDSVFCGVHRDARRLADAARWRRLSKTGHREGAPT